MKILFSSNAPWVPSGYGVQAQLLTDFLKKRNHEIIYVSNFGLHGNTIKYEDMLVIPEPTNWANDGIQFHSEMHKPDAIISLVDWFALKPEAWNSNGVPWFNWTPIDLHLDSNNAIIKNFVDNCYGVVTMSNFGANELTKLGLSSMETIYHAIDPNKFKILDKKLAKSILKIPTDSFVIGLNMANKDASENRKAFPEHFKAIKIFMSRHPKLNIFVYLNGEPSDRMNGYDLIELMKQNNMDLKKVILTHPFRVFCYPYSSDGMASLYNAFDVLLNASSGEGFGVPIIEAQACGVPVITHNDTAMSELTFYGYPVKTNKNDKFAIENFGERYMPDVEDLVNGLEHVLENRNEMEAKQTSEYIRDNFNIEKIGLQWLDVMARADISTEIGL